MNTTTAICTVQDPFTCGKPATIALKFHDPRLPDSLRCERHAKKSARRIKHDLGITAELVRI